MLKIHHLSKKLDDREVLKNLNFQIETGKITGLIGRNGAGKTTLLRTIVGILSPDEGSIQINDVDINDSPINRRQIAYMSDSTSFIKQYNVNELITIYENSYPNFNKFAFMESLNKYNLPFGSLRKYSKGMRTLIYLLLTFSTGANYVILDEPTNGLDPVVKRTVLQLIIEYASSNSVGVLISSHHLAELEKIIDQYLFIKDGRINSISTMEESTNQFYKLQVAFENGLPKQFEEDPAISVFSKTGKVAIIIINGNKDEFIKQMEKANPLLLEELPLTLEDLFFINDGGELYV
ncbi:MULTISPECIES: ATP-binding cassette domain-containing protein [unclassified Bacillus (in: firmicutes)]|uniref:ABC transporter ATP-binding protein n=1 Tax=Bacillaceae TaxID=186817 RepID=UPI0015588B36|nr:MULTISPECIES: ABC transporter ATP-binding protein [unclassified Bacillus (in: firmicutes)]QKE71744.1 ABC transporter ATP-binding protein [Arthrobacter citreus]